MTKMFEMFEKMVKYGKGGSGGMSRSSRQYFARRQRAAAWRMAMPYR